MQAGQNPHDPLTQLNSHLGYGALAGVNPFAEMGLNQNDPNMVRSPLHRPHRSYSPIFTAVSIDDELAPVPTTNGQPHV